MKNNLQSKTPIDLLNDRLVRLNESKGKSTEHIKRVKRRILVLKNLEHYNKFFDVEDAIIHASKHRV